MIASYPIHTRFPIFTPRQRCSQTRILVAPAIFSENLQDSILQSRQENNSHREIFTPLRPSASPIIDLGCGPAPYSRHVAILAIITKLLKKNQGRQLLFYSLLFIKHRKNGRGGVDRLVRFFWSSSTSNRLGARPGRRRCPRPHPRTYTSYLYPRPVSRSICLPPQSTLASPGCLLVAKTRLQITEYCVITKYCVLQYLNQKGVFYPINPENKFKNLYKKKQ